MTMTDRMAELLARADRVVPGPELNRAAWDESEAARALHGDAYSYEIVVPGDTSFVDFAAEQRAKLEAHLATKGLETSGPPALRVWVWSADHAHLFRGDRFLAALRDVRGPVALPAGDRGHDL
jgi:hypothetical protein